MVLRSPGSHSKCILPAEPFRQFSVAVSCTTKYKTHIVSFLYLCTMGGVCVTMCSYVWVYMLVEVRGQHRVSSSIVICIIFLRHGPSLNLFS